MTWTFIHPSLQGAHLGQLKHVCGAFYWHREWWDVWYGTQLVLPEGSLMGKSSNLPWMKIHHPSTFLNIMSEGHCLSISSAILRKLCHSGTKKCSRLPLQDWMSSNSTSHLFQGNPWFSLYSCPSPANVTPSPHLVMQTISKYISHFRKSFHDKYQTSLRKVSKKARYRYYQSFDMSLWNDIQMLLLLST